MGKLVVAGVGIAAVIGGVVWASSTEESPPAADDSPGSYYQAPATSGYGSGYTGSSPNQNNSGPGSPIDGNDVLDAGQKAGEAARNGYDEHIRPRIHPPEVRRPPAAVHVRPPHVP